MVQSQCVKEKKQTEYVELSDYKIAKNAWNIYVLLHLHLLWYKEDAFCEKSGKLSVPCQAGGDLFDAVVGTRYRFIC